MSQVSLPTAVLYFPTIEFRDEAWLRRAICIWDRVERIVPPGVTPRDSADVEALQAAGVVRTVSLGNSDTDAAEASFRKFLKDNPCQPAALVEDFGEVAHLHKSKVGERLQDFFASLNVNTDQGDDWFGIPKSLCHGYMMHLAESVARRRRMSKVTDDFDAFSVSPFYDSDGHVNDGAYSPEDRFGHAIMGLSTIVPKHASAMPIKELLAFRERTVEGRRALAAEVSRCALEVSAIEDPKAAKCRLDDAAAEFERTREVIAKQSMYSAGDLGTSVVCVGLPTFLTAFPAIAAANGGSVLDPLPLAGGAIVALVASMGQAFSNSRQVPIDPARAYYVALQDQAAKVFTTHAGRENSFWRVMEHFVND